MTGTPTPPQVTIRGIRRGTHPEDTVMTGMMSASPVETRGTWPRGFEGQSAREARS